MRHNSLVSMQQGRAPYWQIIRRARRISAARKAASHVLKVGARQGMLALTVLLCQTLFAPYAWAIDALPQGAQVVVGSANITQPTTTHMQVTTHTNRTAINWQSFDIGEPNRVTIAQPNASSLTLNRVKNGQPTKIFGKLDSNGRVVVANPAGVWFGPNSHVDVGGLVAAAADIDPASITENQMTADASKASAGVLADGSIVVSNAGGAALVGRSVEQRGTISTQSGQTTLAAAESFSINLRSDGRLEVQTTKAAADVAALPDGRTPTAAVSQQGTIDARGGSVSLQAAVANTALNEAINVDSYNTATRAVVIGDVIELQSTGDGMVRVKGTLLADASTANGNGGKVRVYGKNVAFEQGAVASARGGSESGNGGTILVGGDYQGQRTADAPVANAKRTYVAEGATLDASAQKNGDGGKVVVWADEATHYAGSSAANAGTNSGNGGLIEVSGAETLGFYGMASVAAANGVQGRILLDPRDITIAAVGADDGNIGTYVFFANPNTTTDVTFSAAAVQALTGAVELQASRNIIVNSALNFSNGATTSVNFRAGQAITTTASIQATGGASLTFNANDTGSSTRLAAANISIGGNIGGATTGAITFSNNGGTGFINLTASQTWQTNNANISTGGMAIRGDAGNNNRTLTINAGSGAVTLGAIGTGTTVPGALNITGSTVSVGAVITGTSALTRAGGAITINATGTVTTGALTTVGGVIASVGQSGGAINITGNGITVGALNTTGGAAAGAGNNGGAGGAITLNAGAGNISATTLTTTGGAATTTGTGGAGGAINISGAGTLVATTVTSTGGASVTGTGGAGGAVTANANTATLSIGAITANGGAATGAGIGGAAGAINLTGVTGLTVTGSVSAVGGATTAATAGGNGANITFNNNVLFTQNATTNILNNGGVGSTAVQGTGGTQTYSGTFTYSPGAARTFTVNAGSGAANFTGAITLNNGSNFDMQADAYSFPTAANSIVTTGNVSLRPGQDSTTIGIGTGAGTWQFNQTYINAISAGIATLTIGRGNGTGTITFGGATVFNSDNITVVSGGNGGNIVFGSDADFDMATSGNRTLLLQSGSGAADSITFQNGALLTNNSGATGSTIFATNNLNLLGGLNANNGNGTMTLRAAAVNGSLGYGGAAGTAQFTQAHIDAMTTFTTITLGNAAGTGAVNIAGTLNSTRSVTIIAGGAGGTVNLNPTAAISLMGGTARTLTIQAGSNAADTLTIQNGATISNTTGATGNVSLLANTLNANAANGAMTGNGTLTLRTVGAANTIGIGTGAGQLSITQAVLDQFGSFVSQTLGAATTVATNINGAITFARTTTITANGSGGSIVLGATTDLNVTGVTQGLTFNTGSGGTYAANINSLVVNSGARVTNTTGGGVSLVVNNIVSGDVGAITGAAGLTIQPTADTVVTGIGSGTGATAVYDQADLDMFSGFTLQTLGRAGGTVALRLGGNVIFNRATTLRAGGSGGAVNFLAGSDVSLSGSNLALIITSGSAGTYTGTPMINTINMAANATLTNNTGAGSSITLNANNLELDPTASIIGNGTVTIQPIATTTVVGVGTGANTAQYTAAELDRFSGFSLLNIGLATSTVAMNIDGTINLALNTAFRSGGTLGNINLGATAVVTMSGADRALAFTPGSSATGTAAQNTFTMANGASIINNTGATSSVTVSANKITINNGASIAGNGIVTIQPNAVNTSVGIGTGAGTLSINANALGAISGFNQQIFGNALGTALITLNGTVNLDRNTIIRSSGAGGTVTNAATGVVTVSGANTLDIITGTAAANAFTNTAGGTITMGSGTLTITANTQTLGSANSISGTGDVVIQSVSTGNAMGFSGGAGQLNMSAANLAALGGFASQTFGRTDGTGAITMNATTFNRTTTIRGLSSTLAANTIDVTGSGNDLTIDTGGLISLANNITTDAGDITLNSGLVRLTGPVTLASTGGNVVIQQSVNSDTVGTARNFAINAGAGSITLGGALGDSVGLLNLSLTAGAGIAVPLVNVIGGGDMSVTLSAGNVTQTGAWTVADDLTVTANTLAGQTITLTQANSIGGTAMLATNTTNGGNITYNNTAAGGTLLGTSTTAGTLSVTSTQGDITQENTSTLTAGTLLITAPAGTFTQGAGAVIAATNFGLSAVGTPTFTTGNTIGTLAAAISAGSFNYEQGSALTIGTVGSLNGINAQAVSLITTVGDITLNQSIVASSGGNAIVLAAGEDFVNNAGNTALQPGTGRWIIYATSPTGTPTFSLGGLTYNNKRYGRSYASYGPGSVVETGNVLLFSDTPTLTVTADSHSRQYGAANPALTYVISGYIDGDTLGTAVSGTPSITTAAVPNSPVSGSPYTITAAAGSLTSPLGYNIAYVDGALTVTPRPLTITVDPSTKVYGNANPGFTVSYGAFASGEDESFLAGTLAFNTAAVDNSPVAGSPYTVTASGLSSSNYAISYVAGDLTITQRPLSITVDPSTKVYGNANPGFTVSYNGFASGEDESFLAGTLAFNTAAVDNSPVAGSPYSVTASGLSNNNYNISYVAGDLTITQRALTVTVNPSTRLYGAGNPAFTVSYSAFATGDNANSLGGALVFNTAAVANSPVAGSPYAVSASGLTSGNYSISYVNGNMTITPRPLTITVNNAMRVEGTANPAFSVSYNTFVAGDNAGDLGGALVFNTAANPASAPGNYAVSASGQTSTNYAITYVNGNLEVQPSGYVPPPPPPAVGMQDIIPSFVFASQPPRILEIASEFGPAYAITEGDTLGQAPSGIIIPTDDAQSWDEVVPDTNNGASDDDDDDYAPSYKRLPSHVSY